MRLSGLLPMLALPLFAQAPPARSDARTADRSSDSARSRELPSIHRIESAKYAGESPAAVFAPAPVTGEFIAAPDAFVGPQVNSALTPPASQPAVDKIVFGFYPSWEAGAAINYSRLTHLAYHAIDPATDGSIATWNGWPGSAPIAAAHAAGVRVLLNITNFNMSPTSTFLATASYRTTLINSVVASVKSANADGVVIDFEGMSVASERANMVSFTQDFRAALRANIPHAEIYLATPAVDWSGVYDYANLAANSDGLFIMAYDYHWAGATTAGPVAMLNSSATWGTYAATWTVNDYLARTTGDRLILGVPYYGYDWPTSSQNTVPSSASASGTAKIYSTAVVNAGTFGRQWNAAGSSPYYTHTATGQPHQCFYDDSQSLGMKYDLAQQKNLAGTGMWALGYDGTRPELYDLLRDKFQLPWPMAIGDLMLTKGSGAVNLAWGAIGISASGKNLSIANYKIYLGTAPDFLTANPASAAAPSATNYSDTTSAGTQFYQVTAVSAQAMEGLVTPPTIVDDAQAAVAGNWTASVNVAGYWGAGYKVKAAGGTGANNLSFTPNLPRAGRYFLLGHHSAATDRTAKAPYAITGRFGLSRRVEVDERYFGGAWVPLGDDDLAGGLQTSLLLDDSAPVFGATTTYVIGDAVLAAPDPRAFILDDHDAARDAGWFASTTVAGYYGDEYQALALPSAATLRWDLDFELEGDYLVEARWTAGANRATAALFTVTDSTGAHPVTINEQAGGNAWTSLGTYHFHRSRGGSILLSSAGASNYLIADAVRVTLQ